MPKRLVLPDITVAFPKFQGLRIGILGVDTFWQSNLLETTHHLEVGVLQVGIFDCPVGVGSIDSYRRPEYECE